MSDTPATREYFIADDDSAIGFKEATHFTPDQWKESLSDTAHAEYRQLRIRALRFLVIPLVFLALHAALVHYGLPQWIVFLTTLFVIIPLDYFRRLTNEVATSSTASGMVELFGIRYFDDKEKLRKLTDADFKALLRKNFFRQTPKKRRDAAVSKFLTVSAGKQKFVMWLTVVLHVVTLAVLSGPFYGLGFALTYVLAIVATVRYFRTASLPLRKISNAGPSTTYVPSDSDTDQKPAKNGKSSKSKAPADDSQEATDEPTGLSDQELLELVIAYHDDPNSLSREDLNGLQMLFPKGVPTPGKLRKMLAEPSDAVPTADETPRAPLPRRPRHRRDAVAQPGPTGTPPHGTPVVRDNVVLSAPVPTPAPTPVPSTPTFTPDQLDELFNKWLALGDDGLTADENKAIESYKPAR